MCLTDYHEAKAMEMCYNKKRKLIVWSMKV